MVIGRGFVAGVVESEVSEEITKNGLVFRSSASNMLLFLEK
jgi:hypothetical protein